MLIDIALIVGYILSVIFCRYAIKSFYSDKKFVRPGFSDFFFTLVPGINIICGLISIWDRIEPPKKFTTKFLNKFFGLTSIENEED